MTCAGRPARKSTPPAPGSASDRRRDPPDRPEAPTARPGRAGRSAISKTNTSRRVHHDPDRQRRPVHAQFRAVDRDPFRPTRTRRKKAPRAKVKAKLGRHQRRRHRRPGQCRLQRDGVQREPVTALPGGDGDCLQFASHRHDEQIGPDAGLERAGDADVAGRERDHLGPAERQWRRHQRRGSAGRSGPGPCRRQHGLHHQSEAT